MAKQISTSSKGTKTKAGWVARTDRGPHTATLPSGMEVVFVVPDSSALLRSSRLPDSLMEIAIMTAAYPDGADGYMGDLATHALMDPEQMPKLAKAVKDGLELQDWLISHMLVEPQVEPDDVKSLPEKDVEMLIQFAERKRDTDAKGVRLPIAMLEVYAQFRDERSGDEDDADRAGVGPHVSGVDAFIDGVPVPVLRDAVGG